MSVEKSDRLVARTETAPHQKRLVTVPEESARPTSRNVSRFAVAIFALLAAALAGALWFLNVGGGATAVAVLTLKAGPVERVLAVSGRTETDIQSDVRSLVSARAAEVPVKEGDKVAAGDLLVMLDAAQQNSRIKQALASLEAAILREQSAQADRDRAVSLRDTLSAVTITNAERDLALAKAEVSRQRAALEQARVALSDYRITAPINGLVLDRSVEPGDLVSPSDILMRLANTDTLYVEVQVDEIYANKIHVGQRTWLQLAGREETLRGTVNFVAAEVDEVTGSLRVKIAFDTIPDAPVGLTTVANILIDRVEAAVTVPRSALVASGSDAAVFVIHDGRAKLTPISFVDWPADRVEVTSGLKEGDRVVLSPAGIKEGEALSARDTQETGG